MPYRVSQSEFDALVADALAKFPPWLINQMNAANLDVVVERSLSTDKRKELELAPGESLLGLYEGIPLDQRTSYGDTVPDKITLFQNEIESAVMSREQLIDEIETTLKHEVHHGFGADESRVHDFGLG